MARLFLRPDATARVKNAPIGLRIGNCNTFGNTIQEDDALTHSIVAGLAAGLPTGTARTRDTDERERGTQ